MPERGDRNLQLGVGKSVIVDLPEDAAEIYVGDPKIANAIVRSARRIYVSAAANGQTTIFALAGDGRRIAKIEVSVGRDVGELINLLNAAIPNNDIHVRTVADSIILTGSVASAGDAQKAFDIASGFLTDASGSFSFGPSGMSATNSSPGKVINSLTIRGLDEISLRVTVAEVRREIIKQLGVTMSGSGPNGSFKLDNPFAINGAITGTEATLNWIHGSGDFSATIQAFERQGVAHTLAEPTVTAVSGESAKFMAGGTIPIANSQSCTGGLCQIGFVQQPYGVTLNFTPVVLSEGRVQLRIATEVTDIDYSHQLTMNGISIPGFRTRNNVTTVELPSGGSIATAGLISTQSQQAINGLPGLMNLPILGALFRSRDYQRNETELLIVVTPYVVHPLNPRDVVRPDKNFEDASDPQAWFLGRVNRIFAPPGTLQPMPAYAGKVGFITE
jgi:pilus assembly protein CpaC